MRTFKRIPKTLTVNGKKYKLNSYMVEDEEDSTSTLNGWWAMLYQPVDNSDGNNMPPEWHSKHGGGYYLCTMNPTKEESERIMLDKLNGDW